MNHVSSGELAAGEPIQPAYPDAQTQAYLGAAAMSRELNAPESATTSEAASRRTEEELRAEVVTHNLRALKARFGETFVKGEALRSGGHAGQGARDLMSQFMEFPDLSERLTGLIPNNHDALSTLRDNVDYITVCLLQAYGEAHPEQQVEPQDPYQLARNAGYTLTGPFTQIKQFTPYASDFRSAERLCTFKEPRQRLEANYMLWLRSDDVDTVPPADLITQANLTPSWRQYLQSIGRYDAATDTFDPSGLRPAREDPYGRSSMSVQISRTGLHVSMKCRYNHVVSNPDSMYGNNLNNVAPGLKQAVYHLVGRDDLMNPGDVKPHYGYVLDDQGGLHRFYGMHNGAHLGYYEFIEGGVVTAVDRGAYNMVAPDLYVRNGTDEVLSVGLAGRAEHQVCQDGSHDLHLYDESGRLQRTYHYARERSRVRGVKLLIADGAEAGNVESNPVLTAVVIGKGASVKDVAYNPELADLTMAEGAKIDDISNNPRLTRLDIVSGAEVNVVHDNPALTEVRVGSGATLDYILDNPRLVIATLDRGAQVWGIIRNPMLRRVFIAHGAEVGNFRDNSTAAQILYTRSVD